ncbi:MAG: histidine phosphatase family protein [Armatimonadota bacterium]|nr:histidine phosphatase family protein [Armatimonadota bacterium]MDR7533559.1 histidine phosphatase family protein [Armatimonadota bacterium]MDR7537359.1 histidine phosphatase family protein [Armatimonadota bacterium]
MRIYLVRHGQTASNLEGRYAGRSKEPLTPTGVAQARRAAERLRPFGIASLWTSPIARARQTAEIIGQMLGVPVVLDDGLTEMAMGPWEGLVEEEVAARYPADFQVWQERPSALRLPGRETLAAVQARALDAVQRIGERTGAQPAVAVTHVALIRCLYLFARGLPLDSYKTVDVPNTAMFLLQQAGDELTMVRLDEEPHARDA